MAEGLRDTLDEWTRAIVERDQAAADAVLAEDYAIVDVFERQDGSWRAAWRVSRKVA